MKKAISALALLVALAAGAAQAADLPSRKGPPPAYPPPPPVMTWTGFYVGGNIGGGWRSRNNAGGGVIGGVQAGYNYQLTPAVRGRRRDRFPGRQHRQYVVEHALSRRSG
jgi:outer membrane immunogenic protein